MEGSNRKRYKAAQKEKAAVKKATRMPSPLGEGGPAGLG
jgi:hypothetical protein